MKKFKFFSFLLIAASSLMFMQCTSEYTPIPGTDGIDGVDGAPGADGVGVQECIDCHSSEHRDAIMTQYAISNHANGTSWARGTSQGCAQCHNNQGFIDLFSGLYFDDEGYPTANLDPDYNPYQTSSPIYCTGCHNSDKGHRSFDFANDGNDYAMRTLDPVSLVIDRSITIDSKNDADTMGYSNTCINCHQPRTPAPTPNAYGNFAVTSSHWGPHHGPQGTFLYGIGGAILPGAMPAIGDATHAKGASCITCHMGEPSEAENGGHTWNPTDNACITCHGDRPEEVEGFADLKATLLAELQTKGLDSTGTKYIIDATGHLQTGTYPVKVAQAAFNYLMLEEDKSEGIHNPEYAKDLAQNSIDALQD
ncbi:MAG TPA: hypothetical protein VJ945_05805 [Flavobacteriaceae bacterium]|nr:hypothetical protein [Flavobacteriaceae bacterium]